MKKIQYYKSILALLLAFMLSIGLVSCTYIQTDNETNAEAYTSEIRDSAVPSDTSGRDTTETVSESAESGITEEAIIISVSDIPEYSGSPYVAIYGNQPNFAQSDYSNGSYEKYSELDRLGRCGVCIAEIGIDLMPTEKRGSIGNVKPSGWQTVKYDIVDGKYLYNRCHLIGYQLSGENDNEQNLITGTRYMNVDGMLPFENMVADYVKETGNHVLYRVTPIFKGNNLLAEGVQMEAVSVEDKGDGICFNVFCYNVQPGVNIDYSDGNSYLETATAATEAASTYSTAAAAEAEQVGEQVWVSKSGSKYHSYPGCSGMKNPTEISRQEAESQGKAPCKKCY